MMEKGAVYRLPVKEWFGCRERLYKPVGVQEPAGDDSM